MSSNREALRPPSLAQHFDSPEDYTGKFGWLCGYSADALFLDEAAERFTRLTRSQRAHQGRIALALLLDPRNPPLSLKDVPGVAHLPFKDNVKMPFRLLHAKVALLGFQHQEDPSQWRLRLLVSTGNWTRQTLEESMDLMWRIDILSESLGGLDVDIERGCADIKAAWDLMNWIQSFFDTRLLNASFHGRLSETNNALSQVERWIVACSKKAQGTSRFFDNRNSSLLAQLPEKIKAGGSVKRNYLAIGSGFYETSDNASKPPDIPMKILQTLGAANLLTQNPEVDIYVNPMACQAVATSLEPLKKSGVTVRAAATPTMVFGEGAQRSLHAKFLFSANYRDNSNACISAWVYLGSGNLTHPGFANRMSPNEGNLEAGVVFDPNPLYWQIEKTTPENLVVTNLLPIQWAEVIGDATLLSAGTDMEQRDAIYVAPPVTWLEWHAAGAVCELRSDDSRFAEVEVLDSAGEACSKTETGYRWREEQPREVCIRWKAGDQSLEAHIPVVDQYGRIAATELPTIDVDEALWQLADFPMPPDEDGGDDGDGDSNEMEGKYSRNGVPVSSLTYPIRQLMNLVESIAAKQTEIDEMDWALWCNRLEQILGQAADSEPVRYFREELRLNPLSPLRHHSFRPSFAETSDSIPGKLYDDTLIRIEENWKVNQLTLIGAAK